MHVVILETLNVYGVMLSCALNVYDNVSDVIRSTKYVCDVIKSTEYIKYEVTIS